MGVYKAFRTWCAAWSTQSATVWRWRARRYELFVALCHVTPEEAILDVGAGTGRALAPYTTTNPIVAVDKELPADRQVQQNLSFIEADATNLPFADCQFPVAFSNSVIEHLPSERRAEFAYEIRRVAHRYFVQTPNRYFPIEPHLQLPLIQFLPEKILRLIDKKLAENAVWEPVRLLSARDLQRLFPDAEIHRERVLGLTKSLMAVRN